MAKLYVIGLGPGNEAHLTSAARRALDEAALICGYTLYAELLRPLYPEKEYYTTGMTGELERCRYCLERAAAGQSAALVCSGDASYAAGTRASTVWPGRYWSLSRSTPARRSR